MNVRIESIHNDTSQTNYISFLQTHKASRGRSDTDSIHSVSSVRSVMSGMSALWSNMGLSNTSKSEKAKLALENDLKYIYGAFTKLPSLRLTPDHRTPLIKGYEQFPFDTAVPLFAFKNVQQLEIIDLDFRNFYGWDRLADQLCLLTIKRGKVDDLTELLTNIVLDDAEKRRRRSNRSQNDAPSTPSWSVPSTPRADYARSQSDSGSPQSVTPGTSPLTQARKDDFVVETTPIRSKPARELGADATSPKRPTPSRPASSYRHVRTYSTRAKRSGSGGSSDNLLASGRNDGTSSNTTQNILPSSKWQRLVYLSLADNGLTHLPERSLTPLMTTLRSFNLSSNCFTEIPDSLSKLSRLVSLDLSNCLIGSLQSLAKYPLHSLIILKLKSNRLQSLAGIEHLKALENLHIQDNNITDPDEAARLTQLPGFRKLWIKQNPMTKSFADYRVRIMNHFRRVPGFVDDILVDDQLPSYTERKQLIERVTEPERPQVSTVEATEEATNVVQTPPDPAGKVGELDKKLSIVPVERQDSANSMRRKKGPRRRIVDLSANDSLQVTAIENEDTPDTPSFAIITPTPYSEQKQLSETNALLMSASPEINIFQDEHSQALGDLSDDDYRRNIEQLRLKFGNNWLSALGEQHWQSEQDLPSQTITHRPPLLHHYHTTPAIVNVGGSLS